MCTMLYICMCTYSMLHICMRVCVYFVYIYIYIYAPLPSIKMETPVSCEESVTAKCFARKLTPASPDVCQSPIFLPFIELTCVCVFVCVRLCVYIANLYISGLIRVESAHRVAFRVGAHLFRMCSLPKMCSLTRICSLAPRVGFRVGDQDTKGIKGVRVKIL
jgi:hypothetical protein